MGEVDVSVGQRITFWRRVAGLKKIELARRFGVSASSVTDWERDQQDPALRTLYRLYKALGVRPRVFWCDEFPDPPEVK